MGFPKHGSRTAFLCFQYKEFVSICRSWIHSTLHNNRLQSHFEIIWISPGDLNFACVPWVLRPIVCPFNCRIPAAYLESEVLTTLTVNFTVFWDVSPSSLVNRYKYLVWFSCRHLYGPEQSRAERCDVWRSGPKYEQRTLKGERVEAPEYWSWRN